jgi:hypothetical protein
MRQLNIAHSASTVVGMGCLITTPDGTRVLHNQAINE